MTTAPTGPSGPAGPGPGRDFTGPTQPAPRPLPNPGPPPAPGGCVELPNPPGPGPKPDGPSGPGRCDCGHGDLPQTFHLSPCPKARPLRLPTLAQIVGEAAKVLNAAIVMLGRQWDPSTGPSDQCDPWGPEAVDISLGSAVADVRSALHELGIITSLISARQSTNSASLPGGPFNHLAVSSVAASGGLLPGLVDAAVSPTAGGTGESEATFAGESSDPGRRLSQRAPEGNGVTPGVGFTVPQTKRFVMPGTERIARSINEALARRSR